MIGVLVNVLAIIVGGFIGLLLKKGLNESRKLKIGDDGYGNTDTEVYMDVKEEENIVNDFKSQYLEKFKKDVMVETLKFRCIMMIFCDSKESFLYTMRKEMTPYG